MVATAKPRRRKSATTSKYFSINSPRPWNTHTVPRLGGRVGSQRAKRNFTPPDDLKTPVVAPLGAGFFASATSSMRAYPPSKHASGLLYSSRRVPETEIEVPALQAAR